MIKVQNMKKLIARTTLVVIGTFCLLSKSNAQVDPHFSQYYVYPAWVNPALTGIFDGSYRVSGIYRNQWGNVSSPFSTPGVSFDFAGNKSLNYGGSLLTQKAGSGGYTYSTAYANAAYTGLKFGKLGFQRLVFGMQAGMVQRKFNISKLTFGDQWNPVTGFNSTTPTAEVLRNPNNISFDMGAGLLYFDAEPGKKQNLYVGYAVSHLTRPDDKFGAYGTAKMPMRHTIHAGMRINLNEQFSITPNILYLKQGTASEKMLGAYGKYKMNETNDFMFGANVRLKDAISSFVGFTFNNMLVSAAYDINTSDLGKLVKGTNSFEISLTIIGRKSTKTPEVEFICPRL
jgi:type IX secretion system PorP/SprF family membrane protein